MQILVVSATEFEIKPFILSNFTSAGEGNTVDILITGVGIASAIYRLTKAVLKKKYDVIIQAGIAGTFTKKIKPGDVVYIEQDCFADIGAKVKGKIISLSDMGFEHRDEHPYINGWLVNPWQMPLNTSLRKATGITIATITDDKKHIKQLLKKLRPAVESMEGAALHYICLQQNIPFIQLRAISNKVGERDKRKWKIKKSISDLNKELIKLINITVMNTKTL